MANLTVIKLIETYLAETTTKAESVSLLDEIYWTLKEARQEVEAKLSAEHVVDDNDSNKENDSIELVSLESTEQPENVGSPVKRFINFYLILWL